MGKKRRTSEGGASGKGREESRGSFQVTEADREQRDGTRGEERVNQREARKKRERSVAITEALVSQLVSLSREGY